MKLIGYVISVEVNSYGCFYPKGDLFAIYERNNVSSYRYLVKNISTGILHSNELDMRTIKRCSSPIKTSKLLKLII